MVGSNRTLTNSELDQQNDQLSSALWKQFVEISKFFNESAIPVTDHLRDAFTQLERLIKDKNTNSEVESIDLTLSYEKRVENDKKICEKLILDCINKYAANDEKLQAIIENYKINRLQHITDHIDAIESKIKRLQDRLQTFSNRTNSEVLTEINSELTELPAISQQLRVWQASSQNIQKYMEIHHVFLQKRYYLQAIKAYTGSLAMDLHYIVLTHKDFFAKCEFILNSDIHTQILLELDEIIFAITNAFVCKDVTRFKEIVAEHQLPVNKSLVLSKAKELHIFIINNILSPKLVNSLSNRITKIDNLDIPLLKLEQAVAQEIIFYLHANEGIMDAALNEILLNYLKIQKVFEDWKSTLTVMQNKHVKVSPFLKLRIDNNTNGLEFIIAEKLKTTHCNIVTKKNMQGYANEIESLLSYLELHNLELRLSEFTSNYLILNTEQNKDRDYFDDRGIAKVEAFDTLSKQYLPDLQNNEESHRTKVLTFLNTFKQKLSFSYSLKTEALASISLIRRSLLIAIDFHKKLKSPSAFFVEFWPDISLFVLGNAMTGLLGEKALRIYMGHKDDALSLLDFALINMLLSGLLPVTFVMMVRCVSAKNQLRLYDEEAAITDINLRVVNNTVTTDVAEIEKFLFDNSQLRKSLDLPQISENHNQGAPIGFMQATTNYAMTTVASTYNAATSLVGGTLGLMYKLYSVPTSMISSYLSWGQKPKIESGKLEDIGTKPAASEKNEVLEQSSLKNIVDIYNGWHLDLNKAFDKFFPSGSRLRKKFVVLHNDIIEAARVKDSYDISSKNKLSEIDIFNSSLFVSAQKELRDEMSSTSNSQTLLDPLISAESKIENEILRNLIDLHQDLVLLEKYLVRFDYDMSNDIKSGQYKMLMLKWNRIRHEGRLLMNDGENMNANLKNCIHQILTGLNDLGWDCHYTLPQPDISSKHVQYTNIQEALNKLGTVPQLINTLISFPDETGHVIQLFNDVKKQLNQSINVYLSTSGLYLENINTLVEKIKKFKESYQALPCHSDLIYFAIFDLVRGKINEGKNGLCDKINKSIQLLIRNIDAYSELCQLDPMNTKNLLNKLGIHIQEVADIMRENREAFMMIAQPSTFNVGLSAELNKTANELSQRTNDAVIFARCMTDFFCEISAALSAVDKLQSSKGCLSYFKKFIPEHWTTFFFGASSCAFLGTLLLKHLSFEEDFTNFGIYAGSGAGVGTLLTLLLVIVKDMLCKPTPLPIKSLVNHIALTDGSLVPNTHRQFKPSRALVQVPQHNGDQLREKRQKRD